MPLDLILTHTLRPRWNVRENSDPPAFAWGSQVSKARPGAPIILTKGFSHRTERAGIDRG
jgi:hypothetical protein